MQLFALLKTLLAVAASTLAMIGPAQATLLARDLDGNNVTDAYFDTDLNITWLRNANAGAGSSFDNGGNATDGLMTWVNAVNWASSYSIGGYDDWRLPTLNPLDSTCSDNFSPGGGFPQMYYGFNCTGSELSHLFVTELGSKANQFVQNQTGDTAEQIANLALFSNMQTHGYWSGTEYAPNADSAWLFYSDSGGQSANEKRSGYFAMAVRDGDVRAAQVPEPESLLLALTALSALALVRRRRGRPSAIQLRPRNLPCTGISASGESSVPRSASGLSLPPRMGEYADHGSARTIKAAFDAFLPP
jgi:hypothetical protein